MYKISDLILHKDNQLLILNKPAGLSVQSDKTEEKSLQDLASIYCKFNVQAPHRLDRPTSGVVIFAKNKKALRFISEHFKERKVKKTYIALVNKNPLPENNTLVNWLKHDKKVNKSKVFDKEMPNTQKAELELEKIGETDKYQILKIKPITGRTHQIRAQLAHVGLAIKGDVKYGFKRGERDRSIFLHASEVEVEHPVSGEILKIKAPVPNNNLWKIADSFIK